MTRSGGLGVMRQFIGKVRDDTTVRDLLVSVAPDRIRDGGAGGRPHRAADDGARLRGRPDGLCARPRRVGRGRRLRAGDRLGPVHRGGARRALREGAVAQGHDALGRRAEAARPRGAAPRTRGGAAARRAGQLPRRADEALARGGPRRPAPRRCSSSATTASCSTGWRPGSPRSSPAPRARRSGCTRVASRRMPRPATTATRGSRSCAGAGTRSTSSSRRSCRRSRSRRSTTTAWPRATRPPRPGWRSSSRPGPPQETPMLQHVKMRLSGGRTAKRAIVATGLELTGLMKPFDLEVWYGERVAVLGSNGSGKSHFLRLLAAGGSDPEREHQPVGDVQPDAGRAHRRRRGWAHGYARGGSPRPTSTRRSSGARCSRSCTAATSTGSASRARRRRGRSTATSWRGRASRPSSRSRVASRPASRSCCSSCRERPCCCSTSRPTTSTSSRPRRSRRGWPASRAPSWP